MNQTRLSVDYIQRSRMRGRQIHNSMTKPKSIMDLVLEERQAEMLKKDENQLNALVSERRKIFVGDKKIIPNS